MQISRTSRPRMSIPSSMRRESSANGAPRDLFVFSSEKKDRTTNETSPPRQGSVDGSGPGKRTEHTVELEGGSSVKSQSVGCGGCGASIAGSGTCGYCGSHNVVMMEGMIVR